MKPCQFPFIFKGETFHSCTTVFDKDVATAEYTYGDPWCSTNTDSDNNHINGNGYYGDCLRESCPSEEEYDFQNNAIDIQPDEDGNYVLDDMILSPEEYHSEYGDPSLVQSSGLRGERSRWKNGGNVLKKYVCT